jgi:cytoskeletal protein CcmA (bactofilin family)
MKAIFKRRWLWILAASLVFFSVVQGATYWRIFGSNSKFTKDVEVVGTADFDAAVNMDSTLGVTGNLTRKGQVLTDTAVTLTSPATSFSAASKGLITLHTASTYTPTGITITGGALGQVIYIRPAVSGTGVGTDAMRFDDSGTTTALGANITLTEGQTKQGLCLICTSAAGDNWSLCAIPYSGTSGTALTLSGNLSAAEIAGSGNITGGADIIASGNAKGVDLVATNDARVANDLTVVRNTVIQGTTKLKGAVTANGNVTSTGTLQGATLTATGTVGGAAVTATGNVQGTDVVATNDGRLANDLTVVRNLFLQGAAAIKGALTANGNITTTGTTATGDFTMTGALTRTAQVFTYSDAKVGAAAGWTVRAGSNLWHSTCAASQSSATLVVNISGLHVGDIITGGYLVGQVESGGNSVQINVELRKITAAAADLTDATVSDVVRATAITGDTILSNSNTTLGTLNETVGADETFYALITVTTAASTDVDLQAFALKVTQK